MEETLIICPRCGSNACAEIISVHGKYWTCYGCGFYSSENSTKNESLPELYKDLEWVDDKNNVWYPSVINIPEKGMVFAEGTSTKDWQWSAIKATKIKKSEKDKFPKDQTHKMDMSKKKTYLEKDFMEALDYINFFE